MCSGNDFLMKSQSVKLNQKTIFDIMQKWRTSEKMRLSRHSNICFVCFGRETLKESDSVYCEPSDKLMSARTLRYVQKSVEAVGTTVRCSTLLGELEHC